MEEIVSADAIRSEILDDAEKKAARILEDAESEAAENVAALEAKAATAVEEMLRISEAKSARFRMETMARFPLERTRMRTAFVDGKLREAVSDFVAALGEERMVALTELMLARGASFFAGKEVELRYRGLSARAVGAVAARTFVAASSVAPLADESLPAPGIIALARDGSVMLRATMDLVEDRLLDERRGELARALCAEAFSLEALDL